MDYNDLKKKAKSLGMKNVLVMKDKLIEYIEQAESGSVAVEPTQNTPKKELEYNAAEITDGVNVVRTYTLKDHKSDFEQMARGFAQRKGYGVRMVRLVDETKCPACGHSFEQK